MECRSWLELKQTDPFKLRSARLGGKSSHFYLICSTPQWAHTQWRWKRTLWWEASRFSLIMTQPNMLSPPKTFMIASALNKDKSFLPSWHLMHSFPVRTVSIDLSHIYVDYQSLVSVHWWLLHLINTSNLQGPQCVTYEVHSMHCHLVSWCWSPSLGVTLSVLTSSISVMFWSGYTPFCKSLYVFCT